MFWSGALSVSEPLKSVGAMFVPSSLVVEYVAARNSGFCKGASLVVTKIGIQRDDVM
jgi:hypothetical protein